MRNDTNYLSIEQCKHNYLYRINSRNLSLGVYNENTKGFSGIRTKFGHRYIFEEYHWDSNPTYGTVHPKEELLVCPIDITTASGDKETALFQWLEQQEQSFLKS